MNADDLRLSQDVIELARATLISRMDRQPGPDGCWLWNGAKHERGYGRVRFHGRLWSTHRLAYLVEHGRLADGDLVLHHCDSPACVRPDHLYVGTHQDNADDRRRGRIGVPRRRVLRAGA